MRRPAAVGTAHISCFLHHFLFFLYFHHRHQNDNLPAIMSAPADQDDDLPQLHFHHWHYQDGVPMMYFAFLIVAAVLWYYAGPPLLVLAAIVLFFIGYWWLCERFPRTMITLTGFIMGLLGRR